MVEPQVTYSDTMLAFHEPPLAVMAPVTKLGNTAGSRKRFQRSQPVRPRLPAAKRSSEGMEDAPAITLNSRYHCVPKTISGDSQMFGFRCQCTMNTTATGNIRFAGNAARNCATACSRPDHCGRMPTHTPTGTHTSAASAMRTTTRSIVAKPSRNTCTTSAKLTSSPTKLTRR